MTRLNFVIILALAFNSLIGAQNIDVLNCKCDSLQKSQIGYGVAFALSGRTVIALKSPEIIGCEVGKFSFDIIVNKEGQVVSAVLNEKNSSEISDDLLKVLTNAATSSQFSNNDDAPLKQKGNITYLFRKKEI